MLVWGLTFCHFKDHSRGLSKFNWLRFIRILYKKKFIDHHETKRNGQEKCEYLALDDISWEYNK